jgi:hypothetical protein
MKRLNRRVLHYSACLILAAAVAAWPSAGWSRTAKHSCNVNTLVPRLLQNWADQLKESWSTNNPELIVRTYAENGVLLPTCDNGPLTGRAAIRGYFEEFLKLEPVATFNMATTRIGGDCPHPFASGLYTFNLGKDGTLQARYTYVFRQTSPSAWLIAQHHSSLQPKPTSTCPSH